VSEEEQAEEAEADTELKTKTPHVNVGKNIAGRPPLSIMYVKPARATAKLKLNGVKQVCQTCQADVNMQPAGQKCQVKHARPTSKHAT